jgi:kanamycin kinase
MSLAWNYPSIEDAELFEAYGVEPDRERIAYYRVRWEE